MSNREIAEPGLVVCTVLCYLGVPPSILKTGIELVVRAVSEQYAEAYGVAEGQKQFRAWKKKFLPFSAVKGLKVIFEFSALGKISIVPITRLYPKATVLQKQLQDYLIRKGAKLGAQKAVAQVLRKVVLVTELAFAGGCLAKCTAETYARMLLLTTKIMADGIGVALDLIEGIGRIANEFGVAVFVRPLMVARATFDQSNWIISGLPDQLARDLNFTFGFLWMTKIKDMNPDQLLEFLGRSMLGAGVPKTLLDEIVRGLAEAKPPQHGFAIIFFPPEILQAENRRQKMATIQSIQALKIYEFIQYLAQNGYLRFKIDPQAIVDQQLGATGSTSGSE